MTFRWLRNSVPWALLALFCIRCVLAMVADGATVDEPLHLAYGERVLTSGTFLRETDSLNSKMPVSMLNALPAMLASRVQPLSWPRHLFIARLPSVLLGALLGFLVWRWARDLFGDAAGVLALFLYTFCPNVLAHSHLVTTDIATALAMFAATYCLWRSVAAPSRARLILAAAVFGAAQLTKSTALLLVPIFALILGLDALRKAESVRAFGRRAARAAGLLLLCGAAAILALNLGFWFEGTGTALRRFPLVSPAFRSLAAIPVLRDVPLPAPYPYIQGLDMVSRDSASGKSWSYLRGQYSQTGFRSYFLWAFLVKVPLATQILLALALWLAASGRARAPGAEAFLLVPVAVLSLFLSLELQLDIGFRYFLPALPFLFVFAARVMAPAARPVWKSLAAAALLAWLAVSSWWVHPHYLPYFNEVAGGPSNGFRWLIDSNLDWNQDAATVRDVYAARSPIPVLFDPSGPVAGRIAVGLTNLAGLDPASARRHAWLRDNFRPIATIGESWRVFDVTETDLARCCAGLPRAWALDDFASDLARLGQPYGGGDGVTGRLMDRLNDGMIGANEPVDAARTVPAQPQPVRAWFAIGWPEPQTIGRIVAFPSFASRGAPARKFLALDYALQSWDGAEWHDIPGTRVAGNRKLRIEHRFAPVRTTSIRLLIESERNERGAAQLEGGFRAACLELAAYAQ